MNKISTIESIKTEMTDDEKLLCEGAWYYIRTAVTVEKKCAYCGSQFGTRLGGKHDSDCIVVYARKTLDRLRRK